MKYLLLYMFLLVCVNTPCITAGKLTKGLNIGTKDKDIVKAIVKTGAKYEVAANSKLCDSNLGQNTIQTEAQCRHAASQLGRTFRKTLNQEGRKPGCIAIRRRVYFNTNPGTTGSTSAASICLKGTCQCGVKGRRPRIVGGRVVYPGEWPWIVLLVFFGTDGSKQWLFGGCGGTLVASQWILTAAHCFHDDDNKQLAFANTISAVIGEHNLRSTNDRYDTKRKNLEIEKIEIHPQFNTGTEYDIALLKLKESVDLSVYMPACLLPGEKDWSGNTAWVYGWGAISNSGRRHSLLREADLSIISNTDCKKMNGWYNGKYYDMEKNITKDMMCADMIGKGSCYLDSGGPLTVDMNNKHYLTGIISWAHGCATDGLPTVFANVSYLRTWIEETVNDNEGADFCSGLD